MRPDVDEETSRRRNFVDPPPSPRFRFGPGNGATLFFADFDAAVRFYGEVLGPPAYVEGEGTRGWPLGWGWLTLLAGGDGAPRNVEVGIVAGSPAEAERLQRAFMEAGAEGDQPSDQLMYVPIRACPVTDPFGTQLLIYAPLAP